MLPKHASRVLCAVYHMLRGRQEFNSRSNEGGAIGDGAADGRWVSEADVKRPHKLKHMLPSKEHILVCSWVLQNPGPFAEHAHFESMPLVDL